MSYLRTWSCLAYVRISYPKIRKLGSRAYECDFIGYSENSKVNRFCDIENKVIIESNDVDFRLNLEIVGAQIVKLVEAQVQVVYL